SETREQAKQHHGNSASPAFTNVSQVKCSKQCRENHCCRPETDSLGESELGVSAEKEFFADSHHHESHGPGDCVERQAPSAERQFSEREPVQRPDSQDLQAFENQAPTDALPEEFSERAFQGQSVLAQWPFLDLSHERGREEQARAQCAF